MKLDAWLRQDHSLDAKLRVVECLCQAVNAVHDRGEALAALDPSRVEIGAEGRCDLSAAQKKGPPARAYAAPDRKSAAPLAAADVYAVGAIAWELLAGRPPGTSPRHLAEERPEIERELADAVMACLESSAEWRPKDLTYLAQMAATRQKKQLQRPSSEERAPQPPRRGTPRQGGRRPRRRTWPLLAALVLVAGLAAIAGRQLLLPTPDPAPARPQAPATPPAAPTSVPASPSSGSSPSPGPEPAAPLSSASREDRPPVAPPPEEARAVASPLPGQEEAAPPVTHPASPLTPVDRPPGRPLESTLAAAPPAEAPTEPAPPEEPVGSPDTPPVSPPEPAPPGPPPVLTAVSPLEVKSPGKVLVDLHGRGFSPRHRARVLPVKKVPWGISVVRQKHVGDSLITILLELTENAEPGEYALAVEDGLGTRSEPVVFAVTR